MKIESLKKLNPHILFATMLFGFLFTANGLAQEHIPVHKEHFHQPIFEAEAFRILFVALNPGDTSDFHLHDSPILYISLRETKVYLFEYGRNARIVTLPNNWIGCEDYTDTHYLIHRIAPCAEDSLSVLAFQIKAHFVLDQNAISTSEDAYDENGFIVSTRKGVGDYFDSNSIPLVIKSGEVLIGTKLFKKGDLITKTAYLEREPSCGLNTLFFWEVSFTVRPTTRIQPINAQ